MTRQDKISKLSREYRLRRMNHESSHGVWMKLRDCVTRQLIAEIRASRRLGAFNKKEVLCHP